MDEERNAQSFDFDWFRRCMVDDLCPHWLAAAVTDTGLFHTELDRQWKRVGEPLGTLVSQSRMLYVLSQGWVLTGDEAYREAVGRGADFLVENFRDAEHGGWVWSCTPDGEVIDGRKSCYGHAFVVLGLAHAWLLTREAKHLDGALDASETIHTRFRDSRGGLAAEMTRDFRDKDKARNQNHIMHLTEALLALAEVDGQRSQLDAARGWIDFLFAPMAERGERALPEDYGMDWKPLANSRISIGHQLEWAYLLSAAVRMGLPESYLKYGESVLDEGMRIGYDTEYGGLCRTASLDGAVTSHTKGFWEQTETIRALANYALCHGRDDLWKPLADAVRFLHTRVVDPEYGGFYGELERDGTPVSTAKGSVWKIDYHTVGMCMELVRLGGIARSLER